MVDSVSVAVGGEVPSGVTDLLVVHEAWGEREESERDASAEALDRSAAVLFKGELAFAGPEHRLDPLADRAERSVAARLVAAVGSQEAGAHARDDLDQLSIGDLWWTARSLPRRQEIVNTYVKCDDEGVEVVVHEASKVDVATRNASFGALVMSPCGPTPRSNSESTI
jgi:hypothetical protein